MAFHSLYRNFELNTVGIRGEMGVWLMILILLLFDQFQSFDCGHAATQHCKVLIEQVEPNTYFQKHIYCITLICRTTKLRGRKQTNTGCHAMFGDKLIYKGTCINIYIYKNIIINSDKSGVNAKRQYLYSHSAQLLCQNTHSTKVPCNEIETQNHVAEKQTYVRFISGQLQIQSDSTSTLYLSIKTTKVL